MRYLADTNILAELARPRPDPGVQTWADGVPALFISVITLEEIVFGLARRPNPRVQAWFEDFLADFCELLPVSTSIAAQAGGLRGQLAKHGRVRSQADMLIVATAIEHQLMLVTRNVRDFEDCGAQILNPFTS